MENDELIHAYIVLGRAYSELQFAEKVVNELAQDLENTEYSSPYDKGVTVSELFEARQSVMVANSDYLAAARAVDFLKKVNAHRG